MNEFFYNLLDSNSKKLIQTKHNMQKSQYGVYEPPTLKQLVNLRYLLENIGYFKELEPESLAGLSRIECQEILKQLNKIYINRRKNHSLIIS